jgi:PAS domain S-box-containing protein
LQPRASAGAPQRSVTSATRATLLEVFEDFARTAFDPALLLDEAGIVRGASPSARALCGAEGDALVGLPFAGLCLAPDAAPVARALGAGRGRIEARLRTRAGPAAVELTVTPAEAGGARGLLLAVRPLAEDRARAVHRLAFEESPDVITLTRLEDGMVVAVNEAFLSRRGCRREDVVGRRMLELGIWAEPEERLELVRRLRQDGTVPAMDIHTRAADGRANVTSFAARLVELEGDWHILSVTRDVTAARALAADHARLLEQFRTQQERLERILDTMQEGVRVADRDGRILFSNARYAEIVHAANASLVGHRYFDFIPPDNLPAAEAMHREVLRGARFRREFPHPLPGGGTAHILNSIAPLRGADGEIVGSVGVLMDVTERKAAEDRLAAEKERLAVTLQSIGDAVIATDAAGRVTLLNPEAQRLTGWPQAEALGRPLGDVFRIVEETSGRPAEDPAARVLRDGVTVGLANHTALIARDGGRCAIADSGAPIRGPDGAILGVVLVFRDQTEERRALRAMEVAEDALRRSEERFRALIENSADILVVFDAERRIRLWSPSAAHCLGWRAEEVLGKRLDELDLVHPDDLPVVAAAARSIADQPGGIARSQARYRHRDGSWRLVEGTGHNLHHDPAVRGLVVNARDITEQRRLQDQLHQSQKLESIGRLAGGVAHDFNNVLTVILSCAETLAEALAGSTAPPEALADVGQIRAAGRRARELTQRLLAFARRQVIAPARLDLNDVVRGSEPLLRRLLGEDVRLVLELAPEPWPVLCDPGQVDQALMNLVVNARDAMPGGGTITLGTRNLPARGPDPAEARDRVALFVRDTGVGLSPEVREHLFEPFFTTKEQGKGTGLGLATVYGIVSQNGGSISVESDPGSGATFELRFPRTDAPVAPARPDAARRRAGWAGQERLLVVEDDPAVRAVTVRALGDAGYRLQVATCGAEALELFDHLPAPIDLVVTDVVMPGMNGWALVEELRRRQPGLRALYVSGHNEEVLASEPRVAPGEFLPKPFTPELLLERVRALLDGK